MRQIRLNQLILALLLLDGLLFTLGDLAESFGAMLQHGVFWRLTTLSRREEMHITACSSYSLTKWLLLSTLITRLYF